MVLGPVKLDAATDPRTCQSHKCRFHYMVIINEVTLLNLVVGHLDTSTQFWQNHHLDILILEIHSLVVLICFLVADRLDDWVRIDHTTRSLIHTFFQKHRSFLRLAYFIGWYRHQLSPSLYHILCKEFKVYRLEMVALLSALVPIPPNSYPWFLDNGSKGR